MPLSFDGAGIITGLQVGGLPDGIVDQDTLATDSVGTAKIVNDAVSAAKMGYNGAVLQIVQATTNTETTVTGTTFGDSGLSGSITPLVADSKILIMISQQWNMSRDAANVGGGFKLLRGSTTLDLLNITSDGRGRGYFFSANDAVTRSYRGRFAFNFLDDPTYTVGNSITYKTQIGGDDSAVNFTCQVDGGTKSTSTMLLLEVKA